MDTEPSLSPRFIAYIRDFLQDKAIDPAPLFEQANLSIDEDGELAPSIPVSKIAKLFELVAEQTHCPNLGIELSEGYHFESASIITLAIMAAPTVEEGMRTLVHYDKYVDSAISVDLTVDGELGFYSFQLITPSGVNVEYLNDYLLCYIVFAMQKAVRKAMPIKKVCFTHQRPANTKKNQFIEDFFAAPVHYGAPVNGIFFNQSYLGEKLSTANSLLYEILCNALKNYYSYSSGHYDFVDTVSREILLQLKKQTPTMASVAESLLMTERTLRRRLHEENLTFIAIKQTARESRARYFLQHTKLSLAEISYELGFSELSAFCRAFRSWTGETPSAYKAACAEPVSVSA